jgi:hypothetical protein
MGRRGEKDGCGDKKRRGDEEKGRNGDEIINLKEDGKVIKISASQRHPLAGS